MTHYTLPPNECPEEPGVLHELVVEDYCRLAADERRRIALDVLANWTTPVELYDVADAVAGRESDTAVVDPERRTRVAITLHHVHLPMMDDLGVLDYDPDATRVESCRIS